MTSPLLDRVRHYMSSFDYLSDEYQLGTYTFFRYRTVIVCGVVGEDLCICVPSEIAHQMLQHDSMIRHFDHPLLDHALRIPAIYIQEEKELIFYMLLSVAGATEHLH